MPVSRRCEQALRLLQLEGETHFFEVPYCLVKCLVRPAIMALFELTHALSDEGAGQVGLVTVGCQQLETFCELIGRRLKCSLFGEDDAANSIGHPTRRKPCQSFE